MEEEEVTAYLTDNTITYVDFLYLHYFSGNAGDLQSQYYEMFDLNMSHILTMFDLGSDCVTCQ